MTRVVSLFLPRWPTDRLRRKSGAASPPRDVPLVLVGREGRRRVVTFVVNVGFGGLRAFGNASGFHGDKQRLERQCLQCCARRYGCGFALDGGLAIVTPAAQRLRCGHEIRAGQLHFVGQHIAAMHAAAHAYPCAC